MNVMNMLRPFKVIMNKDTKIFNSFNDIDIVGTNLEIVVYTIIEARNVQMFTFSGSKITLARVKEERVLVRREVYTRSFIDMYHFFIKLHTSIYSPIH